MVYTTALKDTTSDGPQNGLQALGFDAAAVFLYGALLCSGTPEDKDGNAVTGLKLLEHKAFCASISPIYAAANLVDKVADKINGKK